jgi:hypothetical protein
MTEDAPAAGKASSLPRSTSFPRIANYKGGFLPLGDSNAFTIRGQKTPSLFSRRPSTLKSTERRGSISDSEDDIESFRHGLMMKYDLDAERRISLGAQALNTPQMRSQRLIGQSNPRYNWVRHFKAEEELKQYKKPVYVYFASATKSS